MYTTDMILEFDRVKERLCEHALSQPAKERLAALAPAMGVRECRVRMEETTGARRILDSLGSPPLSAMKEVGRALAICEREGLLTPDQLEAVSIFLASCIRMKGYLQKAETADPGVAGYGQSLRQPDGLKEAIDRSVRNGAVLDAASPALRDLRRRIENEGAQIKRKLDDLLRSRKQLFTDGFVSIRNGRYVLPVKREYKNQVSGLVIGVSGTGGTCFIEPSSVAQAQERINALKAGEEAEIQRVLYALAALVEAALPTLQLNMEAMTALDMAFAKAKLSAELRAVPVPVDTGGVIEIRQGRHPLISRDACVPLDFTIGGGTRGVVITGPNTGGKTVALKTVGLLSLMAQSGLHVPVEDGRFCLRNLVLCDIGDGQSITENLSTFSAHITNIIGILRDAGPDSLVLLDELGSGTDPAEGMGIAVSILEELRGKGCLFVATTHYPEVKDYAAHTGGLVNARMAFDRESLRPLYRLEIGEAGESCALYIAQRLGFPAHMLERARLEARRTARPAAVPDAFDAAPRPAAPAGNRSAPSAAPQLKKEAVRPENARMQSFRLGDSVTVQPEGRLGIVFQPADGRGRVGVQIQGQKCFYSYKRLALKTPAAELYPPDYDFSILFDSVAARKARHQMDKRHVPGLEIAVEKTNV